MSNSLFEISGEKRGRAILDAVHIVVAKEQRPTVERVHAELPEVMFPGFTADPPGQDEIDAAMTLINEQAEQHAASLEQPASSTESAEGSTAVEQPEAPTLAPDQAREYLRLANIALANARARVLTATNKRAVARGHLADCVGAWQSGLPRISRDQAVKEAIASFQQDRANRVQAVTCGPSVIDRQAFFSKGGTASDFLRKQMRTGYRRGALPASMRGAAPLDLGGESRLQRKLEPER